MITVKTLENSVTIDLLRILRSYIAVQFQIKNDNFRCRDACNLTSWDHSYIRNHTNQTYSTRFTNGQLTTVSTLTNLDHIAACY